MAHALLRVEGAVFLVAAISAYWHVGASFWVFAGLLFVPDPSMLGYAAGRRSGAAAYNLAHTLSLPWALGTAGLVTGEPGVVAVALKDGYAGPTVERIGQQAGVGRASIYRRWASKDALAQALREGFLAARRAAARAALEQPTASARRRRPRGGGSICSPPPSTTGCS